MLKIVKFIEKEGKQYLQNGLIQINSEKPEYGSIMVKETGKITAGAFGVVQRTAFYTDRITNLLGLEVNEGSYLEDYTDSVQFRIIRLESLTQELGYRPLLNPSTNEEVSTVDGEPIYWTTKIVLKDSPEKDILLEHAKSEVTATARVLKAEAMMAK